jgi:hypothetical protein
MAEEEFAAVFLRPNKLPVRHVVFVCRGTPVHALMPVVRHRIRRDFPTSNDMREKKSYIPKTIAREQSLLAQRDRGGDSRATG